MSLLLDTNVVSELRKAAKGAAHPQFARWAAQASVSTAFISVITIMELEAGILARQRCDPGQAAVFRVWLDIVESAFDGRTLDVDRRVVKRAAALHIPDPAPYADALIGATALVHGLTIATRNVADFARFAVAVEDPWQ